MAELSGKVHGGRVVRKSTRWRCYQEKYTVAELSGKVHGGRAIRKGTRWQSCKEKYTVAELSGNVHRDSCQKKIDMSVKLHFDRAVLKYTISATDVGKGTSQLRPYFVHIGPLTLV